MMVLVFRDSGPSYRSLENDRGPTGLSYTFIYISNLNLCDMEVTLAIGPKIGIDNSAY